MEARELFSRNLCKESSLPSKSGGVKRMEVRKRGSAFGCQVTFKSEFTLRKFVAFENKTMKNHVKLKVVKETSEM